jgi:hypothetical protein
MEKIVVIINYMPELVVPVDRAWVMEAPAFHNPSVYLLPIDPLALLGCKQRPTCGHHLYHIVWFLHSPQEIVRSIEIARVAKKIAHPLVLTIGHNLHCVPRNEGQPILALLDEGTRKHTMLLEDNNSLQRTEATVKENITSCCKIALQHPQEQTYQLFGLAEQLKQLGWVIFPLYHFNQEHNARPATCGMILISKWVEFTRAEDPPRACPSIMPNQHGLVKA